MKIALLGTGKTGGKVLEVAGDNQVTSFNRSNLPTVAKLKDHDVVISFLSGPVLLEYLPMLIESKVPLVNGSTGMEWPADIDQKLKSVNVAWLTASNFAIGMNLVAAMIEVMSKAPGLFDDYKFHLHEIHHVHKKDAPSGTALFWEKWLGYPVEFTVERTGDVVGDHELTLKTEFESISIHHIAHDRKIFARGAVWAAENLIQNLPPGLHDLKSVMQQRLSIH